MWSRCCCASALLCGRCARASCLLLHACDRLPAACGGPVANALCRAALMCSDAPRSWLKPQHSQPTETALTLLLQLAFTGDRQRRGAARLEPRNRRRQYGQRGAAPLRVARVRRPCHRQGHRDRLPHGPGQRQHEDCCEGVVADRGVHGDCVGHPHERWATAVSCGYLRLHARPLTTQPKLDSPLPPTTPLTPPCITSLLVPPGDLRITPVLDERMLLWAFKAPPAVNVKLAVKGPIGGADLSQFQFIQVRCGGLRICSRTRTLLPPVAAQIATQLCRALLLRRPRSYLFACAHSLHTQAAILHPTPTGHRGSGDPGAVC